MLSEIIGFLSSVAVDDKRAGSRFRVNLNKNRIRSISAYSSNSIFYFPMIVSDQCTPEEAAMAARMSERTNASFVVACISLMPFHRIRSDDKASIEEYLRQFHQNMGFDTHPGDAAFTKLLGFADTLEENYTPEEIKATQDFLLECWEKSKQTQTDFVSLVADNMSILEMYNEDPIDPRLRIIQENFLAKQEELETWGFIGEATDDMFGLTAEDLIGIEDDDDDWDEDDEIDPDDYPDDAEEDLIELLGEAALKTSTRNKLPDAAFGLPSQRKFPLNDKKHVKLAIKMFKHCPEKDRKELAGNIKKAAAKFGVSLDTNGAAAEYLSEASVGESLNSVKFALEAVSENKILSCKNLTKLKTLENKLLALKNRYVRYLNRYKKKYKENKKSGKKSKLVIRFNNMTIGDPKAFMVQYGEYIKVINKRLALVEKRRAQLHFSRGDVVMAKDWTKDKKVNETTALGDISQMEFDIVDRLVDSMDKQLTAPDSEIFEVIEEEDNEDGVLEEATKTNPTNNQIKNYKRRLKDSSRETARERTRAEQQERQTDRYKTLLNRERQNSADAKRNAERLERENERLEKQISDQQKTRAQLRNEKDQLDPNSRLTYSRSRPMNGISPYHAADANHTSFRTFDKEVFTDMDMKKANDAVPTFAKATIGFVIDETEEVVSRDILVGIKSYIHKAPSMELVNDVYNCIINKRKFLKFVKYITGEERSLSDLLFGIKELRSDAFDAKSGAGQWRSAFKRRRRWAKMSIPYLMKEYTPNGTLVMTMNEANFIKAEYGIDIMSDSHVRMIMDADFLLCFMILDQANETVYVVYDGQGYHFQEYSYAMLEREAQTSNRELRELYRAMSR